MTIKANHHCLPRHSLFWLAALVVIAGCGEDAAAPPPPPTGATAPKPRPGAAAPGGQAGTLQFYPKVEQYAEDADEKGGLRHKLSPRDFEADPTGGENRDPFRSYVIRQQGIVDGPIGKPTESTTTEFCTNKSLVAGTYSLRDLRLIGIVLRGTSSYALFRDPASHGHIVRKGDCLGQERARVAEIRTGFVSLEVIPELAPNQEPRPPQERSIQLYPDELPLEAQD